MKRNRTPTLIRPSVRHSPIYCNLQIAHPINQAEQAVAGTSPTAPVRAILPGLRDLYHHVHALLDKVKQQQAYVLIFGPLKSGKSTLMNALSASYVSEVTSLPAYPCMVYVSHSPDREFTVTSYEGTTERHTDPTALHMHIHRSHQELAERIRSNLGG